MFFAFCFLFMLCGVLGILVWLGWQRISTHLNNNPEARRLFAEHVVNPLLLGPKADQPPPDSQAESPHDQEQTAFEKQAS
jgi:hypothetical protein